MGKFLRGFFSDVNGEGSSSRVALYFCLYLLFLEVKHSLNGATVNTDVLYVIAFVIISCVAGNKIEFFSKPNNKNTNEQTDKRSNIGE